MSDYKFFTSFEEHLFVVDQKATDGRNNTFHPDEISFTIYADNLKDARSKLNKMFELLHSSDKAAIEEENKK